MAAEAFFAAFGEVARIVHSRRDGFFMRPVALGMRTEPSSGRTVATFAAHTFAQVESPRSLSDGNVKRVTSQAFRRGLCFTDAENCGHALADIALQRSVGFGVLILHDPGAVFVLQHAIIRARRYAAVARSGCARAGTRVARGLNRLACLNCGAVERESRHHRFLRARNWAKRDTRRHRSKK